MTDASGPWTERLDLSIDGVSLRVATARRDGELAPIVFLHGFGSTKEDYADIALQPAFTGRPFLAYDAPGCGETSCEPSPEISIPFLVKTAQTVLRQAGIRRFHLVGHSMGGLTALLLAHQDPDRVLSFVDRTLADVLQPGCDVGTHRRVPLARQARLTGPPREAIPVAWLRPRPRILVSP